MPGVLVRSALLFYLMILPACSAAKEAISGYQDRFGICTETGTVLVVVEGMARGYTNADLTRLIRKSLARSYQVATAQDMVTGIPDRYLVWHVTNLGPRPVAMLSVDLVRNGSVLHSAFSNIAAPGSNPNGVFMRDASELAKKVLSLEGGAATIAQAPF